MEGKRRPGQLRMRWLDSITNSMDMISDKLWEIVRDREAGCVQSVGHGLATEQHATSWVNIENIMHKIKLKKKTKKKKKKKENIMLGERSQTQDVTYCLTPFI